MEKIIIYPKNKEQLTALKTIAKAIKIHFEVESPYDPIFVEKIMAGEAVKKEGEKGMRVDVKNLWK